MRKKIGFIFLTMLILVQLGGCKGRQVDVTFDAYQDYSGAILQISSGGEQDMTGNISYMSQKRPRVKDMLIQHNVDKIEPLCEYDEFEGWMEYEVIHRKDSEGEETFEYVKRSGDILYTWEEVQEIEVKDEHVLFVAKWKSIPMGAYFTDTSVTEDEQRNEYSMILNANGGIMHFAETNTLEADVYTYWLSKDESVEDVVKTQPENMVIEVLKEGETFAGWDVYIGDSVEWTDANVEKDGSACYAMADNVFLILENSALYQKKLSTEELAKIVCEGKCYYAVANWK